MKYIVVEIQTDKDGKVSTLVSSYDDRDHADQKYYTVLAAAAVSGLPCHSCVMLTNLGTVVAGADYNRIEEERG